jgi:hypothetical protein
MATPYHTHQLTMVSYFVHIAIKLELLGCPLIFIFSSGLIGGKLTMYSFLSIIEYRPNNPIAHHSLALDYSLTPRTNTTMRPHFLSELNRSVWQGVPIDSLKYH